MVLKKVAKKINGAKIQKLEELARATYSSRFEEFKKNFSQEFVSQKLKNSGLDYGEFGESYPFIINQGEGIAVGVSQGKITQKQNKEYVKQVANKINSDVSFLEGIIYFLPFQLNGNKVRDTLKQYIKNDDLKKSKIEFINIPYNDNTLYYLYVDASKKK